MILNKHIIQTFSLIFNKISVYPLVLILFTYSCTLTPSLISHGIPNLDQKKDILIVNYSNKNDVTKELGETILKEYINENIWVYSETQSRKNLLGKKEIIKNNFLILEFNSKGILITKRFLNKNDIKKIELDKSIVETYSMEDSLTRRFLTSMRKRFINIQNKQ